MPSRNQVSGSEKFMAARDISASMQGVGICVNSILEFIAPPLFKSCKELKHLIMAKYNWAADLYREHDVLMQGQSFAFNRQTRSHTDCRGPLGEWTPLIGLGFSRGAKIRLAGIQEILSFEPGSIIFIRGGEIPHGIEAWQGGQRLSIACFTHQNIWDEFNLDYPWSYPYRDLIVITKT